MPMKVICSWCGCSLSVKECQKESLPGNKEPISHGICPDCKEKVLAEIHSINFEEPNPNN